MEHRGTTPSGGIRPSELVALSEQPGPVLTVYLTTEPAIDNAAHRAEQRWKTMRTDLAEAAPERVLAAVDPFVTDAHLHGACLAVVAGDDGVRHVEHGTEPPARDMASWSSVPRMVPLLSWRQAAPAYVLVLADRTGADIVAVRFEGPDIRVEAGGATGPITKSAPGGWSQRRYQQRAENTWEHNADDVARRLESLVAGTGARLVLMGGDVRARQLVRESLPREVLGLVEEITGSRTPDGSELVTAVEVARLVATLAARDTTELLRKFREERGQHDRAADGPEATIDALQRSQVEVLLVPHDAYDDAARAWFGPQPTHIGATAQDVRSLGVAEPTEGPRTDVLVRAALGTGAAVRVIPRAAAPTRGVGAILRWTS
ncbi:MAG TPA: Vms1/Ankzf1 family peptidyl-tRNA hydrolase [Acidimicrobiales bacterium]|jgi:hypothetical protein|nr:Vms1/Ankzf1 family peptidyl-tRNA hydrolase [Acidimicrobiales bacterium]